MISLSQVFTAATSFKCITYGAQLHPSLFRPGNTALYPVNAHTRLSTLYRHAGIHNVRKKTFHTATLLNTLKLCWCINPLNPELNPICYLLALLGAHHFLHVSRIRVKLLTFRRLTSYIYGAPILDVSRSHTTTQHSR